MHFRFPLDGFWINGRHQVPGHPSESCSFLQSISGVSKGDWRPSQEARALRSRSSSGSSFRKTGRFFFDSDWEGYLQTRRSVIGYLVKFKNALILWKSKK
uniref:Uncharacterized protein LOC104221791 isoform X2 n=1 Tax=Nicotiana sylvestris TaxID=4096 RepID=A0A1U7VXX0_NICSY|nr:PREDICTED: uncharacterized protein LOC104221791 isoform X2 [Nicotiana sylvestris]